jgi:hypothetical protein
MRKEGTLMKSNPAKIERDATMVAKRLGGKTCKEIADQHGISKSTAWRTLHDDEIRDVIETATKEIGCPRPQGH